MNTAFKERRAPEEARHSVISLQTVKLALGTCVALRDRHALVDETLHHVGAVHDLALMSRGFGFRDGLEQLGVRATERSDAFCWGGPCAWTRDLLGLFCRLAGG